MLEKVHGKHRFLLISWLLWLSNVPISLNDAIFQADLGDCSTPVLFVVTPWHSLEPTVGPHIAPASLQGRLWCCLPLRGTSLICTVRSQNPLHQMHYNGKSWPLALLQPPKLYTNTVLKVISHCNAKMCMIRTHTNTRQISLIWRYDSHCHGNT